MLLNEKRAGFRNGYSIMSVHSFFFLIRTSKFKFRLTVLNFFENLRLDCS